MKVLVLLGTWVWKGMDAIQLLTAPAVLGVILILGLLVGIPWVIRYRRWMRSLEGVRDEERQAAQVHPVLHLTGQRRKWGLFRRTPMMAHLSPDGFEIERKDYILEGGWEDVSRWERTGLADWSLYFGDEKHDVSLMRSDGFSKRDRTVFDRRMCLHTEGIRELSDAEELRMMMRRTAKAFRQARPGRKFPEEHVESSIEPAE